MTAWRVAVGCEEPSHAGRRARLGKFGRDAGESTWWFEGGIPGARAVPRDEVRSSYRLKCPLCDLTTSVREDRLVPVLDRLADHGVKDVTLRALGATVM